MPIQLVRNDITRMHVDAIVNTSNQHLHGTGGVSGAIHQAAGPQLQTECDKLGGCGIGEAKITHGYLLPCNYVIHTVTPIWQGGHAGEKEQLAACCRNSLKLAVEHGCKSIAFPMLGTGAHGYPADQALKAATDAIGEFLLQHVPDNDLMVYIVTFTRESVNVGSKLFADIRQYIDDVYVDEHFDYRRECAWSMRAECVYEACMPAPGMRRSDDWEPDTIEDALNMIDESFAEMVLRLIKEKGLKNSECYKRANIDKKLISKIVNNPGYKPKKTTALALAVALELPLEETKELLMKAGLAISHSDKFDIIVEFFIKRRQYDIFEINEMLYAFDQPLLGGAIL